MSDELTIREICELAEQEFGRRPHANTVNFWRSRGIRIAGTERAYLRMRMTSRPGHAAILVADRADVEEFFRLIASARPAGRGRMCLGASKGG